MALATVDETGMPDVRMVLAEGFRTGGLRLLHEPRKPQGPRARENPKAALCFHWKSLRRQVRVRGPRRAGHAAEADAYFATRPRLARIGAWASKQSEPLESRFALEKAVALYTARYAVGEVPRPPHWSGFRVVPEEIEFWRDGAFRLHDRVRFSRASGGGWTRARLFP